MALSAARLCVYSHHMFLMSQVGKVVADFCRGRSLVASISQTAVTQLLDNVCYYTDVTAIVANRAWLRRSTFQLHPLPGQAGHYHIDIVPDILSAIGLYMSDDEWANIKCSFADSIAAATAATSATSAASNAALLRPPPSRRVWRRVAATTAFERRAEQAGYPDSARDELLARHAEIFALKAANANLKRTVRYW